MASGTREGELVFLVRAHIIPKRSTESTDAAYSRTPNPREFHAPPTTERRNAGEGADESARHRAASFRVSLPSRTSRDTHTAPTGKPQRSPVIMAEAEARGSENSFSVGISPPSGSRTDIFVMNTESVIKIKSPGITFDAATVREESAADAVTSEHERRSANKRTENAVRRARDILSFISRFTYERIPLHRFL